MKRSFAENDSVRHEVDRKQALQDLEQSIKNLQKLDCPICSEDIDSYYSACARITDLKRKMQVYLIVWTIVIIAFLVLETLKSYSFSILLP